MSITYRTPETYEEADEAYYAGTLEYNDGPLPLGGAECWRPDPLDSHMNEPPSSWNIDLINWRIKEEERWWR